MNIRFSAFAAVLVSLALAPSANAGVISTFIAGVGSHLDHHNDSSFEHLAVDNGAANVLEVGDVLEGIFIIESVGRLGGVLGVDRLDTNTAVLELTGVFRTKILSKSGAPGAFTFTFGPDSGSAFTTTYGDGAMVAMFEDTTPDYNPNAGGGIAVSQAMASNGVLQAVFGFTGALGTATGGEGWSAIGVLTDSILGLPVGGGGFYNANLNYVGTAGDYFSDLGITFSMASFFGDMSPTQFGINGQVFGTAGTTNYPVADSTDIFFQTVTPEPASILAWAGFASIAGLSAYRRRRAK